MLFPRPPFPELSPDYIFTDEALLRYEDVAQDGRLIPISIPPSTNGLWKKVAAHHPGHRNSFLQGVFPILTRITIESLDVQIRLDRAIDARAGFWLAHHGAGDAARIFMNLCVEVRAITGRFGIRPDGPLALAGRMFAEHTYTRPFAPAGQRRVTRLDVEGWPAIPDAVHTPAPPHTAGDAPAGAHWLDELAPDSTEIVFTLDQTDSNQHVNSLVYIRVFLDALQRRLAARGRPLNVLSRDIDIAYQRPCFAGDRARAHLRLFELDGQLGAAGFIAKIDAPEKVCCYIRAGVRGAAESR